jgi:hypothetical protein
MSAIVVDGFGAAIMASAAYLLAQMDPAQVGGLSVGGGWAAGRLVELAFDSGCLSASLGSQNQYARLSNPLSLQIARSQCGPLLEIHLELSNGVVWSPELGSSGGGRMLSLSISQPSIPSKASNVIAPTVPSFRPQARPPACATSSPAGSPASWRSAP